VTNGEPSGRGAGGEDKFLLRGTGRRLTPRVVAHSNLNPECQSLDTSWWSRSMLVVDGKPEPRGRGEATDCTSGTFQTPSKQSLRRYGDGIRGGRDPWWSLPISSR